MTMIKSTLLFFSTLVLFMSSPTFAQLALGSLVWEEDFNGPNGPLDPSRWSYDIGNGNWGWGNGEVQSYTDSTDNVRVEDGSMIIDVKKTLDAQGNNVFTSARAKTNGKVEFQYGSVEVRLKLPDLSNGYWPAFWMLGSNFYSVGWPQTGEIDIMEAGQKGSIDNGIVNSVVSSAAHWSHNDNYATYGEHLNLGSSFVNSWLDFRMDWTPDMISTFVNGQHIWSLDISSCSGDTCTEFHKPYFFIANVAVGGQFTGIMNANDITASPGQMEIDYIKIYNNEVVDATMTIGGIQQAPPNSNPTSAPPAPPDSDNNNADNYVNDYGVIDCGVPDTCTGSVLNTQAGEATCMGHIQWLMKERGRDELYACDTVARKSFPAECGGCNPQVVPPPVNYQFNCGDNSGQLCTNAVLNTEAPFPGHTCGERISHLIEVEGQTEDAACHQVAAIDFPNECGKCHITCGKSAMDQACRNVLDTNAGAHTCRDRITWMMTTKGNTETEACRHVATDSQSAAVCSPCLP